MSSENTNELLGKGVEEIIGEKEFLQALKKEKKLRIKYGVDPTKPDIHLGHTVEMRILKKLQNKGHKIIFLIGDYTSRIGDPSGRNSARPILSDDEIKKNSKSYFDQVGKILDVKKTEIRYNSEWYNKMKFKDILDLASKFTVAQIIERDDFNDRLAKGIDLGMHEIFYPLMQAYDSVMIKADIAFCGSDQRFNEIAGRELQKKMGQVPQSIVICKLLIGLDGKIKMSKSANNYIGITEDPNIVYGKVMSIPDDLIVQYYTLATSNKLEKLNQIEKILKDPSKRRDIKAELAREIVSSLYDLESAVIAENEFNRVFRDKELPLNIKDVKIKNPKCEDLPQMLFDLKLATSKSDARRLIEQGGVKIDKAVISDYKADICFHDKMVVQVGKLKFVRVRI
jgi:tyrosyl-tRNA synthetase